MAVPDWETLQAMPEEEVKVHYDYEAQTAGESLSFHRDALWQKGSERLNREALSIADRTLEATHTMRTLTWVITGLTVVNVVATIVVLAASSCLRRPETVV